MSNSVAVNVGAVELQNTADRERELIPLEFRHRRRLWRYSGRSSAGIASDFRSSLSS